MSNVAAGPWACMRRHSAARFLLVGAACAALSLTIIFAMKASGGFGDACANAVGYGAGLVCGFGLNRSWTFQHRGALAAALPKAAIVLGVAYGLNLALVLLLVRQGVDAYVAQLAGMPVYTALSYAGYRWFAFRADSSLRIAHSAWPVSAALIAAVSLFYRLGDRPLALWDESRLANNALEMAHSGLSLVTTFDGLADHWNTKPPLVVWLMSVAIRLFGATEWAVRLPSALASLATALLVYGFCSLRLRRPTVGFASVMVLLMTSGYMVHHGARAGDYDAMLTLCTTAFLMSAYLYLHGRSADRAKWLALCTLWVLLAFMTKTIQGLIFLPALLLPAAWQGRLPHILRSRAVHASAASVLLVAVGYYLARERVDPGYFEMAQANDLLGRFNTVLDGHEGHAWDYLFRFDRSIWLLPGLGAAVWLAWRGKGERRRLAAYFGVLCLFYLAVISLAKTKLPWYTMPLYPLLAMLVALGLEDLIRRAAAAHHRPAQVFGGLCVAMGALALANNLVVQHHLAQVSAIDERDHYSLFLRSPVLRAAGLRKLVVLHPGYPSSQGVYYMAPTLFYAQVLRRQGYSVVVQPTTEPVPADAEGVVLCGGARAWSAAPPLVSERDCGVYPAKPTLAHGQG